MCPTAARDVPSPGSSASADNRVPDASELRRVVALDGPAGSGKSTVSRLVAEALDWRFVDTGATYRAVTLAVLRAGVDPADASAVAEVAATARVVLTTDPLAPEVLLDGEDVSAEIRGPEVTAAVSAVSAVPAVRELLIALQRQAIGTEGAVVEGRDIATVVAPSAAVKVYLDASPEVRARRRAGDDHTGVAVPHAQVSGGTESSASPQRDHEAVGADLRRRDTLDSQTNVLAASQGAVHLDTSEMSIVQVVEAVVSLVHRAEGVGSAVTDVAARDQQEVAAPGRRDEAAPGRRTGQDVDVT